MTALNEVIQAELQTESSQKAGREAPEAAAKRAAPEAEHDSTKAKRPREDPTQRVYRRGRPHEDDSQIRSV